MARKLRDYDEEYVGNHTLGGLLLKIGIGLLVLIVVCGVVGWFLRWGKAASDVVGPENVKAQWQFAYDYDESMRGVANNWCTLRKQEVQAGKTGDRDTMNQRSSQRIAVEQNYERIKSEYDGRLRDAFRAKWVKPGDVPTKAPTLEEKLTEVGCTEARP